MTTHGLSRHPLRNIWKNIVSRCTNENDKDYHYYGGRGIKICKRWLKLENFIKDITKRPSKKHTIDRINVNRGYSPKNVRWATWKEQHANRR